MKRRLFKTMAAVLAIAAAAAGPVRGQSAQSETLLTTVTATGQTSYSQSPDGIVTVTLNNIEYYSGDYGWLSGSVTVEAPQGYTITRCVFKQYDLNFDRELADDLAPFTATIISGHVSGETSTGDVIGSNNMDGISSIEVYGYAAAQAIELTKAGDNQWSLGQTPDYDLELQVEYYEAHALKDIPAGWTVKVNDIDKTAAIVGDSLMITETDSVTLVPAGNPRRVKSVTLAEDVQTITIGGITLDITGCTTWADIIARNPGVIWDWVGVVASDAGILSTGGEYDEVYPSDPYDPQQTNYHWEVNN